MSVCVCVSATQVITNLVKMVKARDIRRPFCPEGHWLSDEVNIRADKVHICLGILPLLLAHMYPTVSGVDHFKTLYIHCGLGQYLLQAALTSV